MLVAAAQIKQPNLEWLMNSTKIRFHSSDPLILIEQPWLHSWTSMAGSRLHLQERPRETSLSSISPRPCEIWESRSCLSRKNPKYQATRAKVCMRLLAPRVQFSSKLHYQAPNQRRTKFILLQSSLPPRRHLQESSSSHVLLKNHGHECSLLWSKELDDTQTLQFSLEL
jgi:hypothetical protein